MRQGAALFKRHPSPPGLYGFLHPFLFTLVPPLPDHILAEFHRHAEAESAAALRRLKALLEGPADVGPAGHFEGSPPGRTAGTAI